MLSFALFLMNTLVVPYTLNDTPWSGVSALYVSCFWKAQHWNKHSDDIADLCCLINTYLVLRNTSLIRIAAFLGVMISVPDLLKRMRSRSLTQCSWFPIIRKAKTEVENWSRVNIHTEERQTAHKRRGMLLFQLSTWKSKGIKENEIKDKGEVRKTVGKRGKKTIGNEQRGRHWTEVMREETTERRRKGWGSEIKEMSQWRMQRPNTKKKI